LFQRHPVLVARDCRGRVRRLGKLSRACRPHRFGLELQWWRTPRRSPLLVARHHRQPARCRLGFELVPKFQQTRDRRDTPESRLPFTILSPPLRIRVDVLERGKPPFGGSSRIAASIKYWSVSELAVVRNTPAASLARHPWARRISFLELHRCTRTAPSDAEVHASRTFFSGS